MLWAKALKLGLLREWPVCLRLCGIIPEGTVNVGGMGEGSRWRKRCKEMNWIPCSWTLQPQKYMDNKMKEIDTVAMAGEKWVERDKRP